jgi:hypothetical protein
MLRRLRLAALIAAAALQAAAPLSAYARVAKLPDSGDLCSAANVAARGTPAHDAPQPGPAQQHCAQSLCCIAGTTAAGAPPRVRAQTIFAEFASVAIPVSTSSTARTSIIAAARPRGPPSLA